MNKEECKDCCHLYVRGTIGTLMITGLAIVGTATIMVNSLKTVIKINKKLNKVIMRK